MADCPRGVLYVGVTRNLPRRIHEHRTAALEGFTSRCGIRRPVHYEEYPRFMDAVQREKNIRHWPRAWKVRLIEASNPGWVDLYDQLA